MFMLPSRLLAHSSCLFHCLFCSDPIVLDYELVIEPSLLPTQAGVTPGGGYAGASFLT